MRRALRRQCERTATACSHTLSAPPAHYFPPPPVSNLARVRSDSEIAVRVEDTEPTKCSVGDRQFVRKAVSDISGTDSESPPVFDASSSAMTDVPITVRASSNAEPCVLIGAHKAAPTNTLHFPALPRTAHTRWGATFKRFACACGTTISGCRRTA